MQVSMFGATDKGRMDSQFHKVVLEVVPDGAAMPAVQVVLSMGHVASNMRRNNPAFHLDSEKVLQDMPYPQAQKLHACRL